MLSKYPDYMRLSCETCYTEIMDQYFTRCSMNLCTTPFYHDDCLGATTSQNSANWICPKCRFEINHGLSHSDDFIRPGANDHKKTGVVEIFQEMRHDVYAGSSSATLNSLSDEIRALHVELAGLHERFECLNTNLTHTNTKLEDVFSPEGATINHVGQMAYYQVELMSLKDQMSRFHESLKSQIELVGIPEREDEDHFGMVGLAAQKIGVRFHEDDLDWAARLGPRPLTESVNNLSRPLVVRFVQKFKRDQFLRAGKATRNLMTSDLNVDCHPRRVYINERLSREVRCLFHEARFRSRRHGFKFCWIQNNSVFVRKSEGFPAVRLLSQSDLNNKLGDDIIPERDVPDEEPGES